MAMLLLSCWVYNHTKKRYARWQFLVTGAAPLAQPSHTHSPPSDDAEGSERRMRYLTQPVSTTRMP